MQDDQQSNENNTSPLPGEVTIDPELIKRWFAIEGRTSLELELPRVTFDLLYVAIERPYFALAQAVEMVTADHRNDKAGRDAALMQLKIDVANGLNALRRFQTVIMASATGSHLDVHGHVVTDEDQPNGG